MKNDRESLAFLKDNQKLSAAEIQNDIAFCLCTYCEIVELNTQMLDEAIELSKAAVKNTPRRLSKASIKDTLGMALLLRVCCADVLDPLSKISEAIQLVEEALDVFPPNHCQCVEIRARLERMYQKKAEISQRQGAWEGAGKDSDQRRGDGLGEL
jgi:tetratricopeptide (TPR) repeat protein